MLDSSYIRHPNGERLRPLQANLEMMFDESLKRHIGKVSIFSLSEVDVVAHPAQRMDVIGRRSTPSNAAVLRALGNEAFSQRVMDAYVISWLSAQQTLADAIQLINERQHVMVGATHQRTDDIAAVLGSFEIAIQEFSNSQKRASLKLPEDFRAQLLIGKLITGLNAIGVYIPDLLGVIGDVYYTLPHTPTVLKAGFSEKDCIDYNEPVNESMHADEINAKSGLVRAIAMHASTYVEVRHFSATDDETPMVHARPVSTNTAVLMSRHHVIPVAANIEGSRRYPPALSILPIAEHPDHETSHAISEELMEVMASLTGLPHKYHRSKETFVAEALEYHVLGRKIPRERAETT